jgi:hypothetical protein
MAHLHTEMVLIVNKMLLEDVWKVIKDYRKPLSKPLPHGGRGFEIDIPTLRESSYVGKGG